MCLCVNIYIYIHMFFAASDARAWEPLCAVGHPLRRRIVDVCIYTDAWPAYCIIIMSWICLDETFTHRLLALRRVSLKPLQSSAPFASDVTHLSECGVANRTHGFGQGNSGCSHGTGIAIRESTVSHVGST